jgi:hypothetical protein
MSILSEYQYNFGMDKYKLLSSTAGVGAVIATKTGNYVLISSLNKWHFVKMATDIISRERETNMSTVLNESVKRINNELGLETIDDTRFIDFLKISENLSELYMLLPVPEIDLNDFFNTPVWSDHPIKKSIDNSVPNTYMVQATHFPKWFIGKNHKLQTIDKWRIDWQGIIARSNGRVNTSHFAPPRDPGNLKKKNVRRQTDADGNFVEMDIYNTLTQSNLALICEHGHLMDIPWSKYINLSNFRDSSVDFNQEVNCCDNPSLKWTESTNKSEGFENVYIECENCLKKKNLSGINSFSCLCQGHKPWEIEIAGGFAERRIIHPTICSFENSPGIMHVSLVTANRMYYASGKNSLYIPINFKPDGFENQDLIKALNFCNIKFMRACQISEGLQKEDWFQRRVDSEFLIGDLGLSPDVVSQNFIAQLESNFFNEENDTAKDINEYDEENYRLYEYRCFTEAQNNIVTEGLKFNDVEISDKLKSYFNSVKQISELKVTQVQLSFNRNRPRFTFKDQEGNTRSSSKVQRTFEGNDKDQYVLPAVQNYGEGIFFQFNEEKLIEFASDTRFSNIISRNLTSQDQGYNTWEMLRRCGQKYLIVHSFSHLIMRQLEFACGYPTASLKERLFISSDDKDFMAGVIIYTTDGSEGSMGGLVSQASNFNIENLIENALKRGIDCSSDPLCWESDGQGLFGFNLASCFSCSLVSETACEAMNLGLDRRILVDQEFGFFKDLIFN